MSEAPPVISGKVYVVGDNIDTDQIIPAQYLNLVPTIAEEYRQLGSYALIGLPDCDLGRIARVIRDHAPDIVGLQEIGNEAMARELGQLTGMPVVFGPSKGRRDQYGDAILCKHPFKWIGNHPIPSASSSRYQASSVWPRLRRRSSSSVCFGRGHAHCCEKQNREPARNP